jgi:peptidyl-prolyl cis-trans isomerase SurA
MNGKFLILLCAITLLAAALPSGAADVLDRIVATVNGRIILQSDWDAAIRYAVLVDGGPPAQIALEDHKAALDRLIDQELLEEQVRSSEVRHASDEEVTQRVEEIRKQYPEAQADHDWHSLLTRYGLTEEELRRQVARQLDLSRLVDVRLRPGVDVDAQTIESYYNQELLPQLRQSGAKEVPLAEASPKIKELLTQQKVNQLLVAWLQNLRSGSEIQTETPPLDSRDGSR